MTAIQVVLYFLQVVRALRIFNECKLNIKYWFDNERLCKFFLFAVWNLIGTLGALLRNQGTAILLNIYFGPKVNAAYAIANQVSSQTNNLSAAMMGAFTPEITASEGRGDRKRMISLSIRACKMSTILVLFFAVPLIIEMDYVLKLWLVEPPAHTSILCRSIVITFLIDRLTSGYMVAINAHGRIAAYQVTLGTILVLTLPLAWFFLNQGWPPGSVGYVFIITMTCCSLGRIIWVKIILDIPVSRWIKESFYPCLLVFFITLVSSLIPAFALHVSLSRLFLTTSISICMILVATWTVALNNSERSYVIKYFNKLLIYIGRKK
jgi:O-antigen/teichoic acid export membrane protein